MVVQGDAGVVVGVGGHGNVFVMMNVVEAQVVGDEGVERINFVAIMVNGIDHALVVSLISQL